MARDKGLIVPVLKNADRKTVVELTRDANSLIEKARDDKLGPTDVQGGTFTVNNTGALGSVLSMPLINPPQAAIMTTEAIVKRPVVIGDDAIAVRSMMNLCLSFDHRALDGDQAIRFLARVKGLLEGNYERICEGLKGRSEPNYPTFPSNHSVTLLASPGSTRRLTTRPQCDAPSASRCSAPSPISAYSDRGKTRSLLPVTRSKGQGIDEITTPAFRSSLADRDSWARGTREQPCVPLRRDRA